MIIIFYQLGITKLSTVSQSTATIQPTATKPTGTTEPIPAVASNNLFIIATSVEGAIILLLLVFLLVILVVVCVVVSKKNEIIRDQQRAILAGPAMHNKDMTDVPFETDLCSAYR